MVIVQTPIETYMVIVPNSSCNILALTQQWNKMHKIEELLDIMAKLRDRDNGCPWDLKQDFKSITKHTLEEAYEVVDAVNEGDFANLKVELGDLLLQIVFYAQLAKEDGLFQFNDIVEKIIDKLIVRHPHIFSDAKILTAKEQEKSWEKFKDIERKEQNQLSILDNIPKAFPSLVRSNKIQKRVAQIGFDWQSPHDVLEKLEEEITELKQAMADNSNIEEEIGDVLFVISALCRKYKFNSEEVLNKANMKFERRFRQLEEKVKLQGRNIKELTLQELDNIWDDVKKDER